MKRFVLAAALTALISVTALAGEIPTNDVVSPPPPPTSTQSATSTDLNVMLANVLLTVLTLIGR